MNDVNPLNEYEHKEQRCPIERQHIPHAFSLSTSDEDLFCPGVTDTVPPITDGIARAIMDVAVTADGGCSSCVAGLAELFSAYWPAQAHVFTNEGECLPSYFDVA